MTYPPTQGREEIEREVRAEITARLLSSFPHPIQRVAPTTRALHELALIERRLAECERREVRRA